MAHFAKLNNDNIVIDVNVVSNEILDPANEEASGIAFLTEWSNGYTNWKQTSYNGSIRKNFAGIGFTYLPEQDVFIPPKPYPSWKLSHVDYTWKPPKPHPADGKPYFWDENNLEWSEISNGNS